MSEAYEVLPYTIHGLCALLAAKANTSLQDIDCKRHRVYLENYLGALGALTIVVENSYIDRDFLDDFSNYYIRCFKDYSRHCARLHFFSETFDQAAFGDLLRHSPSSITEIQLQDAYLGFLVVKPLPRTVIGRTCLATYKHEGRRHFPTTHQYTANLFGIELTVDSLAFQEQDTVAAACATSALWSAFHGTSFLFQHHVPSPSEITKAATIHAPLNTRTFPANSGLDFTQTAEAIRSVGLEPYFINASDEFALKGTLYAYLKGKIPVLLGVNLIDLQAPVSPNNEPESIGYHAITVAGYSLGGINPVVPHADFRGFQLRAMRIDKIYAHDDQIGPFSRMEFTGADLSTSWDNPSNGNTIVARPLALQIPVYHKIRIPYENTMLAVFNFDDFLERLRPSGVLNIPDRLEWDLYLTSANALRCEIQSNKSFTGNYWEQVVTQQLPRFLWRATALSGDNPFLDLIFDTTDILQGALFVSAIEYVPGTSQIIKPIAEVVANSPSFIDRLDREVIKWFANSTSS